MKYKRYALALQNNFKGQIVSIGIIATNIIFSKHYMIQQKTLGLVVLVCCLILTSASDIGTQQRELQLYIKGVSSNKVIFEQTISLIFSQKDRLSYPITFPKKYATQMILEISAKIDGKNIPKSTQKIKLSRVFFEYKHPNFIEEILGKTLKYYPYLKDAQETYPENFHIKIQYNNSYIIQPSSYVPKIIAYNRFIGSIQNYKSIANSESNITIKIIPSLRILDYSLILDTLPFMMVMNDLIENYLLISENSDNHNVVPQLSVDYQQNTKNLQKSNSLYLATFNKHFTTQILQGIKIGFYQKIMYDVYFTLMEKYKKLAFFDENGYYTLKYSIETITSFINAILEIIFTYVILSNLYQNYENHVGVSLIPAFLFTIQLIPSFLESSQEIFYEPIYYLIAIGIPCFKIYFGNNKSNNLYKQNCKRNDNIFIFGLSFTILLLLLANLQINTDHTSSLHLFILIIQIIGKYFVLISILSQIYQNYKMKSVKHLKKSYIAIICSFALIDDFRLIIAQSKVEVISLLLTDIFVVIMLLQLIKYNDVGEGTKQHAFRAYLQQEKQKRKIELKKIREELKIS